MLITPCPSPTRHALVVPWNSNRSLPAFVFKRSFSESAARILFLLFSAYEYTPGKLQTGEYLLIVEIGLVEPFWTFYFKNTLNLWASLFAMFPARFQ